MHLAIGVVLFALAAIAVQNDADSDRPLPQSLLWFAGVPVAAALATLWAAFLGEAQTVAVQGLERAYPEAMRRDGSFVLTRAIREKSMERHVVDVEHRATGETIDPRVHGSETFGRRWPWFGGSFRLDAPRWHGGSESASVVGASVRLSADGQAWTSGPRGRLQPTGRGPEQQPFAADSTLAEVGEGIVIVDKVSHEVWRYDAGLQHFVPLQLPSGERCRGVERLRLADDDEEARWKAQLVPSGQSWRDAWFLRGERDAFLVRDGVVVAVPGLLERVDREPRERRGSPRVTREEDPLVYTLQLPDDGSPVTFTHEFRPRTAHEWLHAGTAMLWSLQRPPFLQVLGHVGSPPSTAAWAFDRLTIDGRRPWLVGAGILFASILAFGFARRLRRLGVYGAVVVWWGGAIVLFGVPAIVLGFVLERPRRFAQRAVAPPPPAPRIQTPYAPEVA